MTEQSYYNLKRVYCPENFTSASIILDDKNVQVVLINIFGGIMRCDIIAEGIIAAIKEVGIKIPIVVRLEGTNVDLGKKLLQTSGLNIMAANTLTEAATIATSLIKK